MPAWVSTLLRFIRLYQLWTSVSLAQRNCGFSSLAELPGGHSARCMGPPRWIFDEEVLVSTWCLYALFTMHWGYFCPWNTTYEVLTFSLSIHEITRDNSGTLRWLGFPFRTLHSSPLRPALFCDQSAKLTICLCVREKNPPHLPRSR